MWAGNLLKDSFVTPIVNMFLGDAPKPMDSLFDGFPRKITQGKMFLQKVRSLSDAYQCEIKALVYFLEVEEALAIERGLRRAQNPNSSRARLDDNLDSLKNRLTVFRTETLPLKEFFYKHSVPMLEIDGNIDIIGSADAFNRRTKDVNAFVAMNGFSDRQIASL